MKKLNNEEFKQKLFEKHGNNIINKEKYINNNTKIIFHCNKCNHDWSTKPMYLIRNEKPCGCPNCYKKDKIKIYDLKTFKEFVENTTKQEYCVISKKYINNSSKIKIKHNKCNNIYEVRPNDFQQGYRCPYCSHGHARKSNDKFKKEIYNLYKNEYELLSDYKTCKDYVIMKHNKCNNTFKVTPRNFLSNKTRCPYCFNIKYHHNSIHSKNSEFIFNILNENNYTIEIEKSFDDLKYKRYLRFDFYIQELDLLIEYDGSQHFSSKENTFFDNNKFKEIRLRDNLKNQYCKNNKKNLIRLDKNNFCFLNEVLLDIKNKRSTTIEKYNIYSILEYYEYDNGKYNYIE